MVMLEVVENQQMRLARVLQAAVARRVDDLREALPLKLEKLEVEEHRIHALRCKRGLRRGVVEIDHAQIAFGKTIRFQDVIDHELQVGASKDGNSLALEILDAFDVGVGRHGQVDAGAHARFDQQFRFEAVRAAEYGGEVALIGEVDLAIRQRFVDCGSGAFEEQPFNLEAVGFERVFRAVLQLGGCGR
jgi:hypothetical protein